MENLSLAARDMLSVKYGIDCEPLYFSLPEKAEEMAASFARVTLMNLFTVAQSLRETFDEIPVNVQLFALKSADALTDALK